MTKALFVIEGAPFVSNVVQTCTVSEGLAPDTGSWISTKLREICCREHLRLLDVCLRDADACHDRSVSSSKRLLDPDKNVSVLHAGSSAAMLPAVRSMVE